MLLWSSTNFTSSIYAVHNIWQGLFQKKTRSRGWTATHYFQRGYSMSFILPGGICTYFYTHIFHCLGKLPDPVVILRAPISRRDENATAVHLEVQIFSGTAQVRNCKKISFAGTIKSN